MDWTVFVPLLLVEFVVSAAVNGFLVWCQHRPGLPRPAYLAITVATVVIAVLVVVPAMDDAPQAAVLGFGVGGMLGPMVRQAVMAGRTWRRAGRR